MSDFRMIRGFEEVWRPPVSRRKRPEDVLRIGPEAARAKLSRIVRRAPEVMVKVTGRTRDAAHLKAHLEYVSRNGSLDVEDRDGWRLEGPAAVRAVAADWSAAAAMDSRRRSNTPISLALVLSMPAETDAFTVRDAARAFCAAEFAERFDYVFALHTDEPHPHVHVTVRCLGFDGQRLNPKKADLVAWRELFATCLRARGVEAEATPRRTRGVVRKAERGPLRRIRERAERGRARVGRVRRASLVEAALEMSGGKRGPAEWDENILRRQRQVRAMFLGQARLLQSSDSEVDRELGRRVEGFLGEMPRLETQRDELARELREAQHSPGKSRSSGRDKER